MWSVGSYKAYNMEFILFLSVLSLAVAFPSQERQPPRPSCIQMTPEKEQQIDTIVEKLSQFLNDLTIEHENFDIRLLKLSIEQHTEDEEEKETVLQLSVNDCQLSDDELDEIEHHNKAQEKDRDAEKDKEVKKERDEKEAALKKEHESYEKIKALEKQVQTLMKELEDSKHSHVHEEDAENTKIVPVYQDSIGKPGDNGEKDEHLKNNNEDKKDSNANPEGNSQKNNKLKDNDKELKQDNEDSEATPNDTSTLKKNDTVENNPEGNIHITFNNHKKVKPELMYLDLDDNGQKLVKAMGRKKMPIVVYVQQRNSGQTEHWFLKRR